MYQNLPNDKFAPHIIHPGVYKFLGSKKPGILIYLIAIAFSFLLGILIMHSYYSDILGNIIAWIIRRKPCQ